MDKAAVLDAKSEEKRRGFQARPVAGKEEKKCVGVTKQEKPLVGKNGYSYQAVNLGKETPHREKKPVT